MEQKPPETERIKRTFVAADLKGNHLTFSPLYKKEVTESDIMDLSFGEFLKESNNSCVSQAPSLELDKKPNENKKKGSKDTLPLTEHMKEEPTLSNSNPSKRKSNKTPGRRRWKSLSIVVKSVMLFRRYEVTKLHKEETIIEQLNHFCGMVDSKKDLTETTRPFPTAKKPKREAMDRFMKQNQFYEAVSIGCSKSIDFIRSYLKEEPAM